MFKSSIRKFPRTTFFIRNCESDFICKSQILNIKHWWRNELKNKTSRSTTGFSRENSERWNYLNHSSVSLENHLRKIITNIENFFSYRRYPGSSCREMPCHWSGRWTSSWRWWSWVQWNHVSTCLSTRIYRSCTKKSWMYQSCCWTVWMEQADWRMCHLWNSIFQCFY